MTIHAETILKSLLKADDAYYNTTEKNKKYLMLDGVYDKIKDDLESELKSVTDKKLKSKIKKYLSSIGAKIRTSKRTETLPFQIKSLNKVTNKKVTKLKSLIKSTTSDFIKGPKIDGISGTLKYVKGSLVNGFTRGDGFVGQSKIEHFKKVKDLPLNISILDTIYIRGEFVVNLKKFNNLFKNSSYKEARNAVSGWINSDDVENKISSIVTFIAYDILDENGLPLTEHFSNKLKALRYLNDRFPTKYEYVRIQANNLENMLADLDNTLKYYKTFNYETDGLVLELVKYSDRVQVDLNNTTKYPKYAIAYKEDASDSALESGIETQCTNISVSVNKAGLIFPTINFKPVLIGNSNVSKASGKNFLHIINKKINTGAKLSIVKAGGVIPEAFVLKPSNLEHDFKCLCGNKALMFGPNLYCSKPLKCIEVKKSQLDFTLKKLKLTGLGNVNIQKLFNANYLSLFDLLNAKEKHLKLIEGFGDSIIKTIRYGIPAKLKNLSEPELMDCSGVFIRVGLTLSEKSLKDILDKKCKLSGERYELYLDKLAKYDDWKNKLDKALR